MPKSFNKKQIFKSLLKFLIYAILLTLQYHIALYCGIWWHLCIFDNTKIVDSMSKVNYFFSKCTNDMQILPAMTDSEMNPCQRNKDTAKFFHCSWILVDNNIGIYVHPTVRNIEEKFLITKGKILQNSMSFNNQDVKYICAVILIFLTCCPDVSCQRYRINILNPHFLAS